VNEETDMSTGTKTAKARNRRTCKPAAEPASPQKSKLDRLASLLARRNGASIAELTAATGWQTHSVRGALAGALKRRGLIITSEKVDGFRRYRSEKAR
jgi:hypothetical protein